MPPLTLSPRDLLKSGVHYGHRVSRWNPKMRPYSHAKQNLIHIIDVRETVKGIVRAFSFLANLAARGELIVFVGTKRQAGSVIKEQAIRCGMPYVADRWLGGSLTNYDTVRSRLVRLSEIETWETDGTLQTFSKKEQSKINREKRKLLRNLDGLRTMERLPACLVVVDPTQEYIAVAEANKIKAATVALIDSDGDPDKIDLPIPGNDDSMKVIDIVITKLADAVLEGRSRPMAVPKAEEISKAGAVSVSLPEKPGAINVGRGGRPRRTSMPGRFSGPRSQPVVAPPAKPAGK